MEFETALINDLGELNKEIRENKFLKEELINLKEFSGEFMQVVLNIKAQLDEAIVIEENIKD